MRSLSHFGRIPNGRHDVVSVVCVTGSTAFDFCSVDNETFPFAIDLCHAITGAVKKLCRA